ncbi:MAG TPA: hypothetical protein VK507_22770, partial [Iamia sp.]|nr:hypothetical protein [Iamia sp.]
GALRTRLGGADVEALRAAVAAGAPGDVAPAFAALGLAVGPITLRLVGGPSTTVTRAGLLVRDDTLSFATALPPADLMDVLDEMAPGLGVVVDDLTDVAVVSGPDADLVGRTALVCAIAEVETAVRR